MAKWVEVVEMWTERGTTPSLAPPCVIRTILNDATINFTSTISEVQVIWTCAQIFFKTET